MADTPIQTNNQPQPIISFPTRNITITGEYSARMVQSAVRVSRLEQRAIQLAMAPPHVRDAGRRAMDRLHAAQNAYESELADIEKQIAATSRNGNQGDNKRAERETLTVKQNRTAEQRKGNPAAKAQTVGAAGNGAPASVANGETAQPRKKKKKTRSKANSANAQAQQQVGSQSDRKPSPLPSPQAAGVEAKTPAVGPTPIPATPHEAPAPSAVPAAPAGIQSL